MARSEIDSISWCDAELLGLAWEEEGRDLVLRVRAAEVGSNVFQVRTLTCRWAEALDIRLATKPAVGGCPLSAEGAVTYLADGKYALAIDFASTGDLRLVCSELEVSSSPGATAP